MSRASIDLPGLEGIMNLAENMGLDVTSSGKMIAGFIRDALDEDTDDSKTLHKKATEVESFSVEGMFDEE